MILTGSIVNALAIIAGSLMGMGLRNIPETTKESVTKGIGLGVMVLGIQMGIKTTSFIVILISLCLGVMVGEALKIETHMNQGGALLEKRFATSGNNFAEGFVTATLIFLVGSMGIIGAIESGVSLNHQTLFTKSVMDGFMAMMLTATLGISVIFSALPVFIYQGIIALFASIIVQYIPNELLTILMAEISSIGGLMILGIGLNIIGLTKIRVSNFLPSLLILILIITIKFFYF